MQRNKRKRKSLRDRVAASQDAHTLGAYYELQHVLDALPGTVWRNLTGHTRQRSQRTDLDVEDHTTFQVDREQTEAEVLCELVRTLLLEHTLPRYDDDGNDDGNDEGKASLAGIIDCVVDDCIEELVSTIQRVRQLHANGNSLPDDFMSGGVARESVTVKWNRPVPANLPAGALRNTCPADMITAPLENSYSAVIDAARMQSLSASVIERTRYRALATDLRSTST